ncbi:hypothetical protein DHX103_09650 [Planococcus sp. X10-3]|uniref:hypothetical protein n=1 Tax=Planococcus sp. X10-3 TaxID=3061240 RepID=UPI003BAE3D30
MKGFLSFLGITLITIACGAILLSFYGNPLEDLKSQERQLAYQEMRANHSAQGDSQMTVKFSAENGGNVYQIEIGNSCPQPSFNE